MAALEQLRPLVSRHLWPMVSRFGLRNLGIYTGRDDFGNRFDLVLTYLRSAGTQAWR